MSRLSEAIVLPLIRLAKPTIAAVNVVAAATGVGRQGTCL